jgi:hypothetical protein
MRIAVVTLAFFSPVVTPFSAVKRGSRESHRRSPDHGSFIHPFSMLDDSVSTVSYIDSGAFTVKLSEKEGSTADEI